VIVTGRLPGWMESLRVGICWHFALRQLVRFRVRFTDLHACGKIYIQQRYRENLHHRRHRLRDPSGFAGFFDGDQYYKFYAYTQ